MLNRNALHANHAADLQVPVRSEKFSEFLEREGFFVTNFVGKSLNLLRKCTHYRQSFRNLIFSYSHQIKTMKSLLLLSFSLLCLVSCSRDTEAVRTAFEKITTEEEWTEEKAEKLLTKSSLDYLKELIEISDTIDYYTAQMMGFDNNRELVTMKMHGEMCSFNSVLTTPGESLTIDNVLMIMRLNGTGAIGMNAQKMLQFKEVTQVSGNDAEVQVLVATGDRNAKIVSTHLYRKENEVWKLDLLSTMSLEEKLLKQNLRKSPLRNDKTAFIINHLYSPPEEMEFQYRVRK